MYTFYEFFAGGGMARAGLGEKWECLFSNDIDKKKAETYKAHWGSEDFYTGDVRNIKTINLPGIADLVWGSFPCQDLSLAGAGKGLNSKRSGSFWPFWRLVQDLNKEERGPKLIVLENVCGALSSNSGKDFTSIAEAFTKEGYHFGAIIADAAHFLPQSRPRLFIIGVRADVTIPNYMVSAQPTQNWHSKKLIERVSEFPFALAKKWVWWNLPAPPERQENLIDFIELSFSSIPWNTDEQTEYILSLMSNRHLNKIKLAIDKRKTIVGGLYKRMRHGIQRAEVRFDGLAGCLRPPTGGSSRQTIILIQNGKVKSRLLSPKEGAALMGLPSDYILPSNYTDSYKLLGDGVAVPVVEFLTKNILAPLLEENVSLLKPPIRDYKYRERYKKHAT